MSFLASYISYCVVALWTSGLPLLRFGVGVGVVVVFGKSGMEYAVVGPRGLMIRRGNE
jgi:hypothetical protein